MTLKYKGGGFFVGIPARDLTDEEVKKYGGEAYLLTLGLYERSEPKAARKTKKEIQDETKEGETWHTV